MEEEQCNHNPETECKCICHEPWRKHGRIILHDHACCSVCSVCGFRIRCTCKYCSPKDSAIE